MQVISSPRAMQQLCAEWRKSGQSIGIVPTMGALHEGHLSLCRRAREENDKFVSSLFVNPAQFGANEDLSRYPRPFERDRDALEALGCDALLAPTPDAMYPNGNSQTWVESPILEARWEGARRPGHFRGVATVVAKLFHLTCATRAYFGEKDFQQLRVIEQMVDDLNFAIEIVPCPTAREDDGLARSSRNVYLSPQERQAAPVLYRAMRAAAQLAAKGESRASALARAMEDVCASELLVEPDYLAVVDARTLEPLEILGSEPARLLVAARLGSTRLIDNMALTATL